MPVVKLINLVSHNHQSVQNVNLPTISRCKHKVFPFRMLAYQQRRIRRIRTPAHRTIEHFLIFKLRHECSDRLLDTDLRRIRIRIGWVLGMRSRHRNALWRRSTIRLMHLIPREAGELVANFDYTMFIGLEEEADVAIVDDGSVLISASFGWSELDVCIYPGLLSQNRSRKTKFK